MRRLTTACSLTELRAAVALIGALFPGTTAPTDFAAGVEKIIRIERAGRTTHGWIDSYYGNAVIEFENSLKATGRQAETETSPLSRTTKEGRPNRNEEEVSDYIADPADAKHTIVRFKGEKHEPIVAAQQK